MDEEGEVGIQERKGGVGPPQPRGPFPENPRKEGDGFAGDRIWDMEDREWSVFKLKSKFEGLNLKL